MCETDKKAAKCRWDNVHDSWSALSLGKRVGTVTSPQSTHRHMHTSAFPCLSVKGLRRPSKRGREIGQGPAGSLFSPLEDQGRLKLPGPLSLPCYPPSLPACCIRTVETPLRREQSTTRWIKKEVILQWCVGPGWLGTALHVYVWALKIKRTLQQ